MTALSTQQRSAKTAAKRRDVGEDVLRLPVRPGTKALLSELMEWHDIEQMAEAMTLLIHNAHAAGPDGSAALLSIPRHEINITHTVARRLAEFVPPEEKDHE